MGTWGRGDGGDRLAGQLTARSIERAVWLARAGDVDAVVTAPVHKAALHVAGYPFPGVTEFLGSLTGGTETVMMLVVPGLRVALVTTHMPLREVPAQMTTERIVRVGRITQSALRDWFAVAEPRLAVCALNPHAGEAGLFGDEDERLLAPAARTLGAAGHGVRARAARGIRRGACPVPRRRDDGGQGRGVRPRRECDAGVAVPADRTGSRHRVRHRGEGDRGPVVDARGVGDGGAAGGEGGGGGVESGAAGAVIPGLSPGGSRTTMHRQA